jgi:hypothetical protein
MDVIFRTCLFTMNKRPSVLSNVTGSTASSVGFEVVTSVVIKSCIFWEIIPCSPLKVGRRFRGARRLCLHVRRISRARNQLEKQVISLILRPWRWRRHAPPKRRLTFNGVHDVISQTTELFKRPCVYTRRFLEALVMQTLSQVHVQARPTSGKKSVCRVSVM